MVSPFSRALRLVLATGAVTTALCGLTVVTKAEDVEKDKIQGIVVTGSRIQRQDYDANSPMTTVSAKAVTGNADITLETYLNTLPQVIPGGTLTTNNPPNDGQANIDLRGLDANRNLILINGRRPMVSSNDLTVDLNTIPAALISSIEVITGGAGAVYGADAVAGVINIKLKNDFQGFNVSGSWSDSTHYNDAREYTVSAVMGGNFADNRGNAVLAFDKAYRQPMIKSQRPFSVLATSTTGTPPQGVLRWNSGNPIPDSAVDAVFAQYGVTGTNVLAQSGRLGFNRDNTLFYVGLFNSPLNAQNFRDPIDSGVNTRYYPDFYSYNFDAVNLLVLPLDRNSLMSNFRYDVGGGFEFFGSVGWTEYGAASALAPTPVPSINTRAPGSCSSTQVCSTAVTPGSTIQGSLVIPRTNPFISADLNALLDSRTGDDPALVGTGAAEAFLFGIRPVAFGLRKENFENTIVQYMGGLRGPIAGNWNFEAYASEGRNEIDDIQQGNIQTQLLTDVLANPNTAVNGACAGWNPFGTNPIPQACINALSVTTATSRQMRQRIMQGFVRGPAFAMPAGEVATVVGVEYRSFDYDFNPGSGAGPISGFNTQQPEGGNNHFRDIFAEALVPLWDNGAQSVELSLGYRFSKSQFEDVVQSITSEEENSHSYKGELSWRPLDVLRLRGSMQRAVRAPNFDELFQGGGSFPQIFDPCSVSSQARNGANALQLRQLCLNAGVLGGVPLANIDTFIATPGAQASIDTLGTANLKPEKADTYTLGAVFSSPWQNQWAQRLRGTIDYYNIEVRDALLVPDPNVGIAGCFNYYGTNSTYSAADPYCAGLFRSGDILGILDPNDPSGEGFFLNSNSGHIKTSGIDLQLDWGFNLSWLGAAERWGKVDMNLLLTRLLDYKLQDTPGQPMLNYAGTVNYFGGGISLGQTLPNWRASLNTVWTVRKFEVAMRGRFIDSMDNRMTVQYPGETSFTGVPSVWYWDLAGAWQFKKNSTLRIGLNNAFDKQPPEYAPNVQSGTDPSTYDIVGRRLFARLEMNF